MSVWPSTPLALAIQNRKEFVQIDDLATYKRCRVQLHAQGIVLRDSVPGAEIKTKRQQVCKAGDFLVAEIDAKVGGFGIVPKDLDDAIVSSHYFLFEVNENVLNQRFLDFFIRTPAFREQVAAQGSTNYAAIRPNDVLGYKIPLPPLPEQRRIVARIEALATKIDEARSLHRHAVDECKHLLGAALKEFRRGVTVENHRRGRLGDLTTVTSGGTPLRDVPTYWGGDIPWVKTGELVDGDITTTEEFITSEGLANSSAKLFPPDTILIALYGQGQTRGRTGRLTIEAASNQACCAVLPTSGKIEARYMQYWLRSFYHELREVSYGGAQPNWSGGMIKDLEILLLPISEQRRIVTYFDALQTKVDVVKKLQSETDAELAALLPSILDKAFKGEL